MSWRKGHLYTSSRPWRQTRLKVLNRDGYRCIECGKAGRLEVHHIQPMYKYPDIDPLDIDNLQALCRNCHFSKHRRPKNPLVSEWEAHLRNY